MGDSAAGAAKAIIFSLSLRAEQQNVIALLEQLLDREFKGLYSKRGWVVSSSLHRKKEEFDGSREWIY